MQKIVYLTELSISVYAEVINQKVTIDFVRNAQFPTTFTFGNMLTANIDGFDVTLICETKTIQYCRFRIL